MDKTIITISREFGSGGRSIARALSEKLDVPCYDKALIKQISEKTGLSPKYVENAGEHAAGKSTLSFLPSLAGPHNFSSGMSAADFLWCMQRNVILELAEKGPCVIVGRCADYILKDNPDVFHVFIHAVPEFRADRIVRLYGESEKAPQERLSEKDGRRSAHYRHYTGQEWGKCQNYHLSLDSGILGIEKCVSLIADLVREDQWKQEQK